MKIIRYDEYGGPDVLRVVDAPMPQAGPGDVLVRVEAAGINFADTMQRRNAYLQPTPLPAFPGGEIAGTIVAIGTGVTNVAPDTRVMAFLPAGGGYAEYVAVPFDAIIPLPPNLTTMQAPALQVQGLTAYLLLKQAGRLQAGETVLVHAAAGGVGSLAVQLAKALGAGKVIATASTGAKLSLATALGADVGVNYTAPDWSEQVMAATDGHGADIVLDAVGGDTFTHSFACLATFGRLVTYGNLSGQPSEVDTWRLTTPNQSVIGFYLGAYFRQPALIQEAFGALLDGVARSRLQVEVGAVFPLAEAAEAHRRIEARQTTGKVILQP